MRGNIVFQIKSEGLHTPDGFAFTLLVMDMSVFTQKFNYHVTSKTSAALLFFRLRLIFQNFLT